MINSQKLASLRHSLHKIHYEILPSMPGEGSLCSRLLPMRMGSSLEHRLEEGTFIQALTGRVAFQGIIFQSKFLNRLWLFVEA